MGNPPKQTSRGCHILAVVILCLAGFGAWSLYQGVSASVQAEQNLHSTLFMIRLVNHYVQEHERWPDSWHELEAMPFESEAPRSGAPGTNVVRIGGAMTFKWPEQSRELQERVAIDFAAGEADVIAQDVVDFQPIRPIGPYYPYWKYGLIEELQDSLRNSISEERRGAVDQSPDGPGFN